MYRHAHTRLAKLEQRLPAPTAASAQVGDLRDQWQPQLEAAARLGEYTNIEELMLVHLSQFQKIMLQQGEGAFIQRGASLGWSETEARGHWRDILAWNPEDEA